MAKINRYSNTREAKLKKKQMKQNIKFKKNPEVQF